MLLPFPHEGGNGRDPPLPSVLQAALSGIARKASLMMRAVNTPLVHATLRSDREQLPSFFTLHLRSYWIPGSYAPTVFKNRSAFLRSLKNKGFKEERVEKIGADTLDKSTTLESNKSVLSLEHTHNVSDPPPVRLLTGDGVASHGGRALSCPRTGMIISGSWRKRWWWPASLEKRPIMPTSWASTSIVRRISPSLVRTFSVVW